MQPTAKAWFIEQLDWLAEAQPLAWHFRNTAALAAELAALAPGYEHTPRAALPLLEALRRRGAVLNAAAVARIEALAVAATGGS